MTVDWQHAFDWLGAVMWLTLIIDCSPGNSKKYYCPAWGRLCNEFGFFYQFNVNWYATLYKKYKTNMNRFATELEYLDSWSVTRSSCKIITMKVISLKSIYTIVRLKMKQPYIDHLKRQFNLLKYTIQYVSCGKWLG